MLIHFSKKGPNKRSYVESQNQSHLKMEGTLQGTDLTPSLHSIKMEAQKDKRTFQASAYYREAGQHRVPCGRGGQGDISVLGVTL